MEDAHRAGRGLTLGARDVLTHEAATRARELGVAVAREEPGLPGRGFAAGGPGGEGDRALRAAVRAAVIAERGADTPGVDEAIEKVFARRKA